MLQTGIQLQDGFTTVMYSIINSVQMACGQMQNLESAMNSTVDTTVWENIESEINQATAAVDEMASVLEDTLDPIHDNTDAQEQFNQEVQNGVQSATDLQKVLTKAGAALFSAAAIKKTIGFIDDCTDAFDVQRDAEMQLMTVLANMLDADYVSQFSVDANVTQATDAIDAVQNSVSEVVIPVSAETQALLAEFDAITAKAAEIQSRGIYGDEIMIAGAAELSTYFTDTDAMTMMMDTLANYAMGMSGGGELDATAMVDYATGLGKIMVGSYDAMTEKGFEFTDAQKAIIEGAATEQQIVAALGTEYLTMSADMQAAAAITQVINESWAGLYKTMSNTPRGQIIQMTNAWGDIKEVIGKQLYPYILLFVHAITDNWSTIESIINGFVTGLQFIMGILSWLVEGAFNFASVIIDNWSWISPIIWGIIGALAVYGTYLAITKGIELACAAAKGVMAVASGIQAAAQMILIGATWAATTAQLGLNGALYACPIVWILILVIALIAAFYVLAAALTKITDVAISGTGLIIATILSAAAVLWNVFVGVYNLLTELFAMLFNLVLSFVEFFANVWTDPIGSIVRLFADLADVVLGLLGAIASALDAIFGSQLAEGVRGWQDSLDNMVEEKFGEGTLSLMRMNPEDTKLDRWAYEDAFDMGMNLGISIDDKIADFTKIFDVPEIENPFDVDSLIGDIGSINENTGDIRDSLDVTQEDLKYLRDIAEQDAINRFTIAEVTIEQTNNNNISSDMDLDGIVSGLTNAANEAVDSITEGVHS